MIIFKIEKLQFPWLKTTVVISFTIWIQAPAKLLLSKLNFKCSVLIKKNLKSFPLIQWENQSFFSNLTGLEHKDLLPLTDFFYYQCVAHWKVTCDFFVSSTLIVKKISGAHPCGWNWQRCHHFEFIWTCDSPMLTLL